MNTINIVGRVGREPEQRQAGQNTVASFSVAVSHGKDKTSWFNVQAWGKNAETVMNYVHKGDLVGVTGQHVEDSWADRETGETRKKWVLDASRVHLMPKATNARDEATVDDDEALPF